MSGVNNSAKDAATASAGHECMWRLTMRGVPCVLQIQACKYCKGLAGVLNCSKFKRNEWCITAAARGAPQLSRITSLPFATFCLKMQSQQPAKMQHDCKNDINIRLVCTE